MLLIVAISCLLIFFWTGVYTSFEASFQFYRAAQEVYGALTFWALLLLTVIICLMPRFCIKFFQKNYRPYDVDVIREQVRQGKFDYLNAYDSFVPPKALSASATSSDTAAEDIDSHAAPSKSHHMRDSSMTESQRPIYPPSEAPTARTRHPHSQTGSDDTNGTRPSFDMMRTMQPRRQSMERISDTIEEVRPRKGHFTRPSLERGPSSFDRTRQSFDRLRPSFEGSRDFTSAALLTRMESAHSHPSHYHMSPLTPTATSSRRHDITEEL